MKQCFNRVFATILVVALIAPPIVLSMPQRVYAQQLNFGTGIPTGATGGGSLFGGAPAPLDGGTFGSVPTSGNNFGADPLHTNPGLGDVAPAGGAAAAPCTASLLAITAAVGVDIAGGLKVLGFGTGQSGSTADIPKSASACLMSTMSLIQQSITSTATIASAAAEKALVFKAFVLDPLAFVVSGNLLKAITKGTIEFVIGKMNGTGLPQFVADIQKSMQTVSDGKALAYFNQYVRSSRSPWNTAIISQLSKEYLNKTSLLGFWAQNMDTLRRTSPNPYGFLSGVWLPGDTATWFALVTQTQNNPYSMYANAQSQLGTILGPGAGGATGVKVQDINNGRGFVSWCGPTDGFLGSVASFTTSTAAAANAAAVDQAAADAYDAAYNQTMEAIVGGGSPAAEQAGNDAYDRVINAGGTVEAAKTAYDSARESQAIVEAKAAGKAAYEATYANAKAANAGNSFLGVAPGDPCTNADGTTGTIQTPGSVIAASLNKALGGQQDQVVRMGDVGGQINGILSNIVTVLKVVQFGSQILGGPGSRGLFGVDQPTPGQNRSALQAYANSPGNLGVTESTVLRNAATLQSSVSDLLNRTAQYETAINTIGAATNSASTSVTSLLAYCTTQQQVASSTLQTGNPIDLANLAAFTAASAAQIGTAQTAFGSIMSVITRVSAASTTIANARALVQKVQAESTSTDPATIATYVTDVQSLETTPPSLKDIATLQSNSTATGAVVATPPGSLNVTGGSFVDRLNLISSNATTLQSVCAVPTPVPPTPTPTPIPTP